MSTLFANGFNIGTDISGAISDSYGDVIPFENMGNLMSIDLTFDMHQLKVTPITNGGKPIYLSVPNGLSGSMDFTRFNGSMTSMFTALYEAFYGGGLLPHFSIMLAVLNRSGTVDEYIIPELVFDTPDFGKFTGIEDVTQSLKFSAPTVIATGGAQTLLAALPLTGLLVP